MNIERLNGFLLDIDKVASMFILYHSQEEGYRLNMIDDEQHESTYLVTQKTIDDYSEYL